MGEGGFWCVGDGVERECWGKSPFDTIMMFVSMFCFCICLPFLLQFMHASTKICMQASTLFLVCTHVQTPMYSPFPAVPLGLSSWQRQHPYIPFPSQIVIMAEATRTMSMHLPVIVASVVANTIAGWCKQDGMMSRV